MKFHARAALAAFVAIAATIAGPLGAVGSAQAGNWRSYVDKYGGGYWVDKYVAEDKNGNVRYKGSKHDKWSGKYYNTKTGKWTGKKYDGEWGGRSYTSNSSNSSGSSGKTRKASSGNADAYAEKPAAKPTGQGQGQGQEYAIEGERQTAKHRVVKKAPAVTDQDTVEPPKAAQKEGPQASYDAEETYGPPEPVEIGMSAID